MNAANDVNLRLIWIDLEMTGLYPDRDKIIEIATVVTDAELNTVAEGPVIAIYQDDAILDGMDEWNTKQHNKTGLIKRVKESTYQVADAEKMTLEFLRQHLAENKSPMCGNSICQDRRFLSRYMPALESFFHYRNLDVSTLKELAKRWVPDIIKGFTKKNQHLALADIYESIEELKYYRQHLFQDKCSGNE